MRMITAALLATLLAGPALAEFRYVESKDAFDESKLRGIVTIKENGHGSMSFTSARNTQPISRDDYHLAWAPSGQSFICGRGEKEFVSVRWLHVDPDGTINKMDTDPIIFSVRTNKRMMDLSNDKFRQNWNSVKLFFDAVQRPGAVRLTYSDECGARVLEEIPTDGFAEALAKAGS